MKDSNKVENIDDYISDFSVETQKYLNEMRELIRKLAPDSVESISYAIPTFSLNGKYLVYFAGFKNHIGLYPTPVGMEAFKEELSNYKTGKGSVQFPLNKPLPIALITKIVKYQIEQNEIKTKK
ncbi:MAG: DUF1801 domain-containing protein [Saprospiraceae bacterium]